MSSSTNYLLDKDFLLELDKYPHKEVYAKIISLNFKEEQMEEIQGRVTSGSINIDGSSAVRRTCALSLISQDININDVYWGLNTKFKLEVGIVNEVNSEYPDIIWFPEGIYLITSFNEQIQNNSHTISIGGKDKMCLLNGEIGGAMHALSTDFGTIDETNSNGVTTTKDRLIRDIIRDAVHEYAKEPMENIIVNDLNEKGLELMEYRGNDPMYMFINSDSNECTQITLNKAQKVYLVKDDGSTEETTINALENSSFIWDPRIELDLDTTNIIPSLIKLNENSDVKYSIVKVEYGDIPGYRTTGLTYAGELILSAGDHLTSVLDKIVKMLGEYEYFYNLDGKFVFQKKKTYINTSFNNIVQNYDESYAENASETSAVQYSFEGNNLVSSFRNTPNLSNLKNDYSLWGTRESATGSEIPVHIRYAIDKKPKEYVSFAGVHYYSDESLYNSAVNTVKRGILSYDKEINNNGLIEPIMNEDCTWAAGWWKVTDWAEYYKQLTGEYPNGMLSAYCNSLYKFDSSLNDLFPEPAHDGTKTYYGNSLALQIKWNSTKNAWYYYRNGVEYGQIGSFGKWTGNPSICIFDVNNDGTLGYYGHTYNNINGCTHNYTDYFVSSNNDYGMTSYIYNPTIPESIYKTEVQDKIDAKYKLVDWRELIYQMAIDYNHLYYSTDDFLMNLKNNNGIDENGDWIYPNGITGYEQYYTDMEGFWRQLYCPSDDYYQESISKINFRNANDDEIFMRNYDRATYSYIYTDINCVKNYGVTGEAASISEITVTIGDNSDEATSSVYYKLYDNNGDEILPEDNIGKIYVYVDSDKNSNYYLGVTDYFVSIKFTYDNYTNYYKHGYGWMEEVTESPQLLNFWFDFLDSDAQMKKYAVYAIGDRTKSVNDDDIKAIYFRETPTVIFFDPKKDNELEREDGYTYIQCPSYMESLFTMSSQGKSAKDVLDENLYNYTYCVENVSITALPVYYLEPNVRIFIHDNTTGINGEYIVSKISLPLSHNGTMTITATKAAERLY